MKVAIICSGGTERLDGGGIFLKQALASLAGNEVQVIRFLIGKEGDAAYSFTSDEAFYDVPVRGPVRGLGRLRKISRVVADWFEWGVVRHVELRKSVREVSNFLTEFGPDVVLCIMNSMEPILVMQSITKTLGVPVVTMEWDPPSSIAHVLDLPRFQVGRVLNAYEDLVRKARGVGVTSDGMAETYKRRFGRDAVILRQYVDTGEISTSCSRNNERKEWLLYLAGNAYAKQEFDTFLAALDLCGWMLHGLPVTLRWLSSGAEFWAPGPCRIEFLGWQQHGRALELASQCDLGYVSYWFDPARSEEAKNCFPSKMVSYMGVGLPPFFHGPSDSSPAVFLGKYDAGHVCTKTTPDGVLDDLKIALGDLDRWQRWRELCLDVAKTEFSRATFTMRFNQLLGGDC